MRKSRTSVDKNETVLEKKLRLRLEFLKWVRETDWEALLSKKKKL